MEDEILEKVARQKSALKKEPYIPVKTRKELLRGLYRNIKNCQNEIFDALKCDLNKSEEESYMTEVGIVLGEIRYMLRHLSSFARKKRVKTPLSLFPATSYKVASPRGMALIISPWNYPFLLSMQPLVDAVAAGNRVILKPSSNSPHVGDIIKKILGQSFDAAMACVVLGSADVCNILLDQDFDYIFYTGSMRVGQIVMEKANKHFTPYTLEMGGKSPCIVDESADIKSAARRIIFGKLLNAGQTCVAPDFVYCHKSVREKLIEQLKCEIINQYGIDVIYNDRYPRIVNAKRFDAALSLIDPSKVIYGGKSERALLKIEPTIVGASFEDKIMKEEIFAPILPIVTFESVNELVENLNKLTKPLAFYLFSSDKKRQEYILTHCNFGGGCINDTIMHIANHHLGFGGIRESGIGAYHGKVGFDTFSHYKSIVKKGKIDLPMRYQPIGKIKYFLIKTFLR